MFEKGILLLLDYTNVLGVRAPRLVRPVRLEVRPSLWHGPPPRLCLVACDVVREVERDFLCQHIHAITTVPECPHCRGACQEDGLDCACEAIYGMVAEGCPHD